MSEINCLWMGKIGDANAWYHIYPFVRAKNCKRLHVVRYKQPSKNILGVEYHLYSRINVFIESFA
jgi:hypothetical protein